MQIKYTAGRPTYYDANDLELRDGDFLRHVRRTRCLTQKDLARELNLNINTVRAWEQGTRRISRAGQAALIAAFEPTFRSHKPYRTFCTQHGLLPCGVGVRVIRIMLRNTREELAAYLKVSPATVIGWEHNYIPSRQHYHKIVDLWEKHHANQI